MDKALLDAINELLDACDYAGQVLDNYGDLENVGYGRMEPNSAAVMSKELPRLAAIVEAYLPKEAA